MKKALFITDDFLLETKESRRLFHDYAADLPIIDYHCHLPPADVATDKRWENLTQIWLYGDHYKWRAMRTNGVEERYCTGKASDLEKFEKWAATMPYLLRNPLYHWTHLELARYFNISDRLLSPDTAKEIWTRCNRELAKPAFSCRGLMKRFNVQVVCTTDDPTDTLEHHQAIAKDKSFKVQVLPTWRPDKGMAVDNPKGFNAWVDKLAERTNVDIRDFDSFTKALRKRHEFFHSLGCRLSDHGLDTAYAADFTESEMRAFFKQIRSGKALDGDQILKFKSGMLVEFGIMDHARNWTQQFHFGALRNNNSRLLAALGPDTGFDSIGDDAIGRALSRFLDRLNSSNQLTRTIVYNLNPRDNALLITMMGNFQDGSIPGKMQFGSGWWFLDQKDGMERQMEDLSQMGLLSRFVGMTTDSRSFLSYTRHEYFRRILCNKLGNDMARGLIPADMALVGQMVQDISYNNAARYFGFNVQKKD
jgi:glucuronate isomerase